MTEWMENWTLCSSHVNEYKQKHVRTSDALFPRVFFFVFDRDKKKGKGCSCGCVFFTPGGRKRAGTCWHDRMKVFPRLTA